MSCAGRGTTRDPKDFYATPKPAFSPLLPFLPPLATFHDPCAGDGRLVLWMREHGLKAEGTELEYREETYLRVPYGWDFLEDNTRRDFIITNPPFSLAFEMAKHARRNASHVAFLLRLSFLESDERGEWFEKNEPNGLFVLKKRPNFVMSVTCKSGVWEKETMPRVCKHNWILPIESERPKVCPKCGGAKLAISTSDSSGYAWFVWSDYPTLQGIHHI